MNVKPESLRWHMATPESLRRHMATVLLMQSHRTSLKPDFAEMIKIESFKKPSTKAFLKFLTSLFSFEETAQKTGEPPCGKTHFLKWVSRDINKSVKTNCYGFAKHYLAKRIGGAVGFHPSPHKLLKKPHQNFAVRYARHSKKLDQKLFSRYAPNVAKG